MKGCEELTRYRVGKNREISHNFLLILSLGTEFSTPLLTPGRAAGSYMQISKSEPDLGTIAWHYPKRFWNTFFWTLSTRFPLRLSIERPQFNWEVFVRRSVALTCFQGVAALTGREMIFRGLGQRHQSLRKKFTMIKALRVAYARNDEK
jgi:hypothetical protein